MSVVLPAPLRPRRAVAPPPKRTETSSRAVTLPNRLVTRSATTSVGTVVEDMPVSGLYISGGRPAPANSGGGSRRIGIDRAPLLVAPGVGRTCKEENTGDRVAVA